MKRTSQHLVLVFIVLTTLLMGCRRGTPEPITVTQEPPLAGEEEAIVENGSTAESNPPVDRNAIEAVVMEHLQDTDAAVGQSVEIQQVAGEYARARVSPADSADGAGAIAFLKRENGEWKLLALGTEFSSEELKTIGVPSTLLPAGWVIANELARSSMTDVRAIDDAVRHYLQAQDNADGTIRVEIDKIEGDYARVQIHSGESDSANDLVAFLRRQDEGWTTLVAGSSFTAEQLTDLGIPESIQPQ